MDKEIRVRCDEKTKAKEMAWQKKQGRTLSQAVRIAYEKWWKRKI